MIDFLVAPAYDGIPVLELWGELDIEAAPLLNDAAAAMLAASRERVVLDCSELSFCDSSGLNCLLRIRRRAVEHGCDLVLAHVTDRVRKVLELTGTYQVLPVTATVPEALQRAHPASGAR